MLQSVANIWEFKWFCLLKFVFIKYGRIYVLYADFEWIRSWYIIYVKVCIVYAVYIFFHCVWTWRKSNIFCSSFFSLYYGVKHISTWRFNSNWYIPIDDDLSQRHSYGSTHTIFIFANWYLSFILHFVVICRSGDVENQSLYWATYVWLTRSYIPFGNSRLMA